MDATADARVHFRCTQTNQILCTVRLIRAGRVLWYRHLHQGPGQLLKIHREALALALAHHGGQAHYQLMLPIKN